MQAVKVHIGAWSLTGEMGSVKLTKLEEMSTKLLHSAYSTKIE